LVAGLQLQRPIDVLGGCLHSIFSQIEARENQVGLSRLANTESGFGLGAGFAGIAASVVVFVLSQRCGKGGEGRGARGIDRGGVPEFSMTAAVYIRGLLEHEYGVKPGDVEWVQGRADRLGRKLPANIRLTQAPAGTELGDLLERGDIDFMMTANNPLSFRRGNSKVQRLFPDYAAAEKDYYRRTKIYPIMHTVVIRRDIYERDPWVALSLYKALCTAKDRCYHFLAEQGSPKVSSAWLQPLLEEEQDIIGPDWFPYGIEKNRPSIEALLQYTNEHGLTSRRVKLEELFAPSTLRDIPLGDGQQN